MAKHASDPAPAGDSTPSAGLRTARPLRDRALVEALAYSSQCCWIVRPGYGLVWVNRKAVALTGVAEAERIAQPLESLACWPLQQSKKIAQALAAALAGKPARREVELSVEDRGSVQLELIVTPIFGPDGNADLLLVEARDLADQQAIANALRESESRFHDAFDHAAIGMAIVSPDGRLLQVNPAFCQIIGYTDDELLKRALGELTHAADRKADAHQLKRLVSGQARSAHFEKRLLHSDGREVWVLQSTSVVRDEHDQAVHMLCQIQDITQRTHSQEKLLQSEGMFRGILESAPDAILLTDRLGKISLVNARAELMFGYNRDQMIGQPIERLLPAQQPHLGSAGGSAVRSPLLHKSIGPTARGRRSDGTEFPVEVSLSPLAMPKTGLSVRIVRDITRQQQIAVELESRARQEAAIAAFGRRAVAQPQVAVLVDEACQLVTQTLEATFAGVLVLDDSGNSLEFETVWFSSEYSDAIRAKIDWWLSDHLGSMAGHAIRTSQPVVVGDAEHETRFDTTLTRSYGAVSAAAVPIKLQERPYGVLAVYSLSPREFSIEDVHFIEAVAYLLAVAMERKYAEEALRRDRDFAERLIETAQAIVLLLDIRGRITRWNRFTEDLTGFSLSEVRGTQWTSTLLPPDGLKAGEEFLEAIVGGKQLCSTIHTINTGHGGQREIEWSGRALTDENGAVIGVLLVGHDISELRVAQRRVLESERLAAIGQMASGLAHESRNALQQIGACSEMLSMELEGNTEALDLVAGVQEAEDRLHRLFEDVRVYAVPLQVKRRRVDLAEVWRSAWSHVQAAHSGRDARLEEHCLEDDRTCPVDPRTLEQAFSNLFDNSMDACSDPVVVRVFCEADTLDGAPALRVRVRDNGPGLGAEAFRRVLEPFYTTKTQGTGLGTAIVQRIVQAHGGRFEVVPCQLGAEFAITLPCSEPA